jgi:hypothetical protein
MLVELAAANAAFAVIKEAVQNSGDLMNAGQAIFQYFDSKSVIQKKYEDKAKNARTNDIEEFFALEQLKKQEVELREMMQWQGRAGMWTDWLEFQKQAKHKRIAAEKAELRAAAARKAKAWAIAGWTLIGTLLSALIVLGIWIADQLKGRGS